MADTKNIEIQEETISYLEDKIVSSVFPLLTAKTTGVWRSAGKSDNIQQCLDKSILNLILAHLRKKVNIVLLYSTACVLIHSSAMILVYYECARQQCRSFNPGF